MEIAKGWLCYLPCRIKLEEDTPENQAQLLSASSKVTRTRFKSNVINLRKEIKHIIACQIASSNPVTHLCNIQSHFWFICLVETS
jgi:hypothetical protein